MRASSLTVILILFSLNIQSQIVGTDVYMKGKYIQLGISGLGGFEGANASSNPVPSGYNQRPIGTYFGIVANPQLNNFAAPNFDGDFFTPGSPENGWGFELINGATDIKASNNCLSLLNIAGSITSHVVTAVTSTTIWNGNYTGSGYDLDFQIKYTIDTGALYYTTTVSITNNSGVTIPDFYYYRNVDPDNNQSISGDYTTTNNIMSQPAGAVIKAEVSAKSSIPWLSSMAFVGYGTDFRVSYGGFSNRDATDIWNGVGGLTGTIGSTIFADQAISLAYRKINFANGATETFHFFTVFADSLLNEDFDAEELIYTGAGTIIDNGGSGDSVYACGPLDIVIDGCSCTDMNWAWSPNTYLNVDTGVAVTSTALDTITYTATGTPVGPGPVEVFTFTVFPSVPPAIAITDPGPQCTTFDLSTLVIVDTSGSATSTTFHSISPASATDMSNQLVSSIINAPDSVYVMMANAISGCYDIELVLIDWDDIYFNLVVNPSACSDSTGYATITDLVASPGTYSILWSTGDTASLLVTDLPPGPVSVTITNSTGCSSTQTDTIIENTFSANYSTISSGCGNPNGSITTSMVGDSSSVYTYNWSNGATSSNLIGIVGGVYSVIITNQDGCSIYDTITVGNISSTFSLTNSVFNASCGTCANGTIYTFLAGSPTLPVTYSWSNGATTPNLFAILPGLYVVTVTDAAGCIFVDSFFVSYPGAVDDLNNDFRLIVFPNPANDYLSIEASIPLEELSMVGVDGRVLVIMNPNKAKYLLDVSAIDKGVYTLIVKGENKIKAIRVIKN